METPPAPAAPDKSSAAAVSPRVRAIFRAEALEHHRQRHSAAVHPPFISGRRFVLLWLFVALLLASIAAVAASLQGLLFPG